MVLAGDSNVWLPLSSLVGRDKGDDAVALFGSPEPSRRSNSIVVVRRWTISLQPVLCHATSQCIVVPLVAQLHHCVVLCSRLIISSVLRAQFVPASPGHSSTTMPRVRDW